MLRFPVAVLATAFLFATSAGAQTTVLVMDTERVLQTSAVGTHIRERLSVIGEEIRTELQTEEASVRTDVEAFNNATADRTEEQIAADEALSTRRAELQNRMIELGVSEQVKQRELAATQQAALEPVQAALQQVLQSIVEAKGADVLLERDMVIYVDEDTADITQEVIDALNARMSTVEVQRVRLPVAPPGGG